jgi:hypothetical protein
MLLDKLKVLISALPAQLAAVQTVLAALGTLVVVLPTPWQAKALVVLGAVSGIVAAAVRVVSSVTPVPQGAHGLALAPGEKLRVEFTHQAGGTSAIETTG